MSVQVNGLTHHDILASIAPFIRSGRHLDAQASDRLARRLVFRPTANAGLRETLSLQVGPGGNYFRLTRTLCPPAGPQARLDAEGTDAGELLACVDAVSASRQWSQLQGVTVARHHGVAPGATLTLTGADVQVHGVALHMRVPSTDGLSALFDLEPTQPLNSTRLDGLPDDVMAVLGWAWSPLKRGAAGWQCSVRLQGRGGERSSDAETKLSLAAHQLSAWWGHASGNDAWHRRWRWARWAVALRRAIPVLVCGGLVAELASAGAAQVAQGTGMRGPVLLAATGLLMLFFARSEGPRIEWPPFPPVPRFPPFRAWPPWP